MSVSDKGLFRDIIAPFEGASFDETADIEEKFEVVEHLLAATHHDAVRFARERRQVDGCKEFPRGKKIDDTVAVARPLARDERIVDQFGAYPRSQNRICFKIGDDRLCVAQVVRPASCVNEHDRRKSLVSLTVPHDLKNRRDDDPASEKVEAWALFEAVEHEFAAGPPTDPELVARP